MLCRGTSTRREPLRPKGNALWVSFERLPDGLEGFVLGIGVFFTGPPQPSYLCTFCRVVSYLCTFLCFSHPRARSALALGAFAPGGSRGLRRTHTHALRAGLGANGLERGRRGRRQQRRQSRPNGASWMAKPAAALHALRAFFGDVLVCATASMNIRNSAPRKPPRGYAGWSALVVRRRTLGVSQGHPMDDQPQPRPRRPRGAGYRNTNGKTVRFAAHAYYGARGAIFLR